VVYLADDACQALAHWLQVRRWQTALIFSGHGGRPLSYEVARSNFKRLLVQADLAHKGYTLHGLRHTFASELLNAGMRLECLQPLLGHSQIEMTRRYARLTDVTRKEEYFRAMAKIEKEGVHGDYRCDFNYRRFLKRRNCSRYTLRNYMNTLKHFVIWIAEPIEQVTARTILSFIDHLLDKRLSAKTINCYLDGIRGFYDYLIHEENVQIANPVKRGYVLKLARPLPRYLRDEEIPRLFAVIDQKRDRAIFMLMLRCGLG